MKIVIVNGSSRKGNTYAAIQAFIEGAKKTNEIEVIEPDHLNLSSCKGCNACGCYNGCVAKDDTNAMADQLVAADMIVYTTPVYWWGMSAQLKLVIDKSYCKAGLLKGKKIGVIVCGGSPLSHPQYDLIKGQFDCMAEYLHWDMQFYRNYYVYDKDDLKRNSAALAELQELGERLS